MASLGSSGFLTFSAGFSLGRDSLQRAVAGVDGKIGVEKRITIGRRRSVEQARLTGLAKQPRMRREDDGLFVLPHATAKLDVPVGVGRRPLVAPSLVERAGANQKAAAADGRAVP